MSLPENPVPAAPNLRLELRNVPTRELRADVHKFLLIEHGAKPSGDGSYSLHCDGYRLEMLIKYIEAVFSADIQIRIIPIEDSTPCSLIRLPSSQSSIGDRVPSIF